ncbi:MAG: hypothetical protein B9S32_14500 [Verrucomicrobia bacterium Tous-C9LFEB]|nr:MAG: hypothetical protein B9S32_14500 [Verrucomicrobia bacterium Tous-C9LFEB]
MSFSPLLPLDILLPLGAMLLLAGIGLAWRGNNRCSLGLRLLAVGARALGLVALLLIALNPGSWRALEKEQPSGWAILVDRSLSMASAEGNQTRWQQAVSIAEKAVKQSRRTERAKVYTFAGNLDEENAKKIADQIPSGETTDIVRSGRSLLAQWPATGLHLNGIVLLSDGRQIAPGKGMDLAQLARSQGVPIFPLLIGSGRQVKDISVAPGRSQYFGFPGQKTKITAMVHNRGYNRINPKVELLDGKDKVVASSEIRFENEPTGTVVLDYTPAAAGFQKLKLRVTSFPEESTLQNNEREVSLVVLSNKTKIFIAEGVPTWDSKFLAQLFRSQPQLDVTAVFRLSADHYYRVSSAEASMTSDAEAIFPSTTAELEKYDIIVFGKGAEYFLTPERTDLLRQFIHDKGGCVVFARGKPYEGRFPLLEVIEPVVWGEAIDSPFRLQPTEVGQEAGLFDDALSPDSEIWKQLPPVSAANRIEQQKSFAEVMVDAVAGESSRQSTFPAVISRRYGKGMVLAVNADGLWQWDFFSAARDAGNIYREFWTQLMQWAITYSDFLPGQDFSLKLSETTVKPDTTIRVRVASRQSGALQAPSLRLLRGETMVRELGQPQRIPDAIAWELFFNGTEAGVYQVELYNPKDKKILGRAPFEVVEPPGEKDNLEPDTEFMRQLAENSGGRVIRESDLPALARELEPEKKSLDESNARWTPLWDSGWLLIAICALFAVEWIIRRRNGLL